MRIHTPLKSIFLLLAGSLFLSLAACSPQANPPAEAAAGLSSTQSLPSVTPLTPTSTPTAPSVWLDPNLPAALNAELHLPAGWETAAQPDPAGVSLTVQPQAPLSRYVLALAAPFDTLADNISLAELQALWLHAAPTPEVSTLLVDKATRALLTALWGRPSPAVQVTLAENQLDLAWKQAATWALVPFEQLEPRWKVISVEGANPLADAFDPAAYPLSLPIGLSGPASQVQALLQALEAEGLTLLPASNRNPSRLTSVVVTGVTALVRGTASTMERKGMTYPAEDVGDILRAADILHVSNEVAFDKKCPAPYPWEGLKFCSREKYIELLDSIGVDVVELTGDHFGDWSVDAMNNTLAMYAERGWPVYGGGATEEQGRQAAKFEVNGNKIAFIGCNAKEKAYSTASAAGPGAVHCDSAWLLPAIAQLKAEGYLPIVTFQHLEYYDYSAKPALQADFRAAAAAGAVIVSGSQAHQPHAMEFDGRAFLHYGLGDLFFDQLYFNPESAKAFIDRHVFYDGRYLNTQLVSIRFVDYARPRLMTAEERVELLQTVFTASGWTTP